VMGLSVSLREDMVNPLLQRCPQQPHNIFRVKGT
jgi:hypothetical protein